MKLLSLAIAAWSGIAVAIPANQTKVTPPPLEVTGEVELSASRVRRETDPTREVILTLITVNRPSNAVKADEPSAYAFVVEDDATGQLLEHFRGAGKVVHAGSILSVWNGTKDGWRFEQRNTKKDAIPPDRRLRVIPALSIRRYRPAKGRDVDHQELARTVFSGKVKR
jgi:hypothetical protein